MSDPDPRLPSPDDGPLDHAVHKERERKATSEPERSVAQNMSMLGALGAAIVLPMLLGIFAGRWLDHRFGTNVFWTLSLLFVGLVAGCAAAWKRISGE